LRFRSIVLTAILYLPTFLALPLARPENEKGIGLQSTSSLIPIGEHLIYTIKWDPPWYLFFLPNMTAGELDLQLEGQAEFKNKPLLKIVLRARSSGTLAKLAGMKVEDEFIFYTEPGTFCTQGALGTIREGKRRRRQELEYLSESRQLHFREIDEAVVPPKLKKDIVKESIPACVQDPFSALYAYRGETLQQGLVRTHVIGNDDKIKEVRTHVEKQETVSTPSGQFVSWKIRTDALKGGLFKEGGQFYVWLSADERKLPIQFEAKVSLGRVLGVLKSVTSRPIAY
jgi:hypothetical protein